MNWTHDLAMLEARLSAAMREVGAARAELERVEHYDQRTSEWWCDQVHRARAEERARVVAFLRARGVRNAPANPMDCYFTAAYENAANQIARGEHEEEP